LVVPVYLGAPYVFLIKPFVLIKKKKKTREGIPIPPNMFPKTQPIRPLTKVMH